VSTQVVNRLEGSSRDLASDYRVSFAFLFSAGAQVVRLTYNPDGWDTSRSARWQPRSAAGAQDDQSDWDGNDPAQVSFEWRVDAAGDPQGLELVLAQLETLPFEVRRPDTEPAMVDLSFGRHQYRGNVTQLSVTRVRTDPSGNARVALVNCTFQVNPKATRGTQRGQ